MPGAAWLALWHGQAALASAACGQGWRGPRHHLPAGKRPLNLLEPGLRLQWNPAGAFHKSPAPWPEWPTPILDPLPPLTPSICPAESYEDRFGLVNPKAAFRTIVFPEGWHQSHNS